jgi:NADH-quinone oxidoreductase B subunit
MGITSFCRKKSPWVMRFSCGGCNGCDIELTAITTPRYDIERFGALLEGSPRHSDILMVTGTVTKQVKDRLVQIYEQMPEPKVVMAVGVCAVSNGVFYDGYNVEGPLDKIIPVDVYVPGCPPKPEAIIGGLLKAKELLGKKK